MGQPSLVSVIVTTKNESDTIRQCLNSVVGQTYSPTELIVVDNASTDGTSEIVVEYTHKAFIRGPERSAQRNYGAERSSGSYVLFIDADMQLSRTVIEECVQMVECNHALGALIIPEYSVGDGFWAACKALERQCYIGDDLIEAARFFRRDVFEMCGGYDELLTGPEDFDLSKRVRSRYGIGRITGPILHHEGRLTLQELIRKKYYYAQGFSRFARKHPDIALRRANLVFRKAFWRHRRQLLKHPLLGLGMFVMRTCELVAGLAGFSSAWLRRKAGPVSLQSGE